MLRPNDFVLGRSYNSAYLSIFSNNVAVFNIMVEIVIMIVINLKIEMDIYLTGEWEYLLMIFIL